MSRDYEGMLGGSRIYRNKLLLHKDAGQEQLPGELMNHCKQAVYTEYCEWVCFQGSEGESPSRMLEFQVWEFMFQECVDSSLGIVAFII